MKKKSYLKPLIGKIVISVISTDSVIQSKDIAELHVPSLPKSAKE